MIPALVPVGAADGAKSRLRPALGDATRRIVLAMLGDVLEVLLSVPGLGPVVAVTPAAAVAEAARTVGAGARGRPDPGLNAAVDAAAEALARDAASVLVVLGDVPGLRAAEIETLLEAAPARGVALAPSRDGGSSALVRSPPDVIAGGYGPDSAARHRRLCEQAGVVWRECPLPSLALDVDDAGDLDQLLASDAPAPRTRAALRELGGAG